MAVTVIYAVELSDLERWIGCRDERRLREARELPDEQEEEEEASGGVVAGTGLDP